MINAGVPPPIKGSASADPTRFSDSLFLRVLSAIVLAPATIGATYAGGPVFAGLVAFLVIIMCFEWARMIDGAEMTPLFYTLASFGAAAIILASAGQFGFAYLACAIGAVAATLAVHDRSGRYGWASFGVFYILAPTVALLWLREAVDNGRGITLLLFAIVWSADSGAYFAGRIVGGPRLSPSLSPAKTWAGTVGGSITGTIAGVVGASMVFARDDWAMFALMGGSLGLASILGDMCESAFKRNFGIKDMSGFIPGHGGALDRLDGMIFATIAMTAVLFAHILVAGAMGSNG